MPKQVFKVTATYDGQRQVDEVIIRLPTKGSPGTITCEGKFKLEIFDGAGFLRESKRDGSHTLTQAELMEFPLFSEVYAFLSSKLHQGRDLQDEQPVAPEPAPEPEVSPEPEPEVVP
jgi:hypothetical protein